MIKTVDLLGYTKFENVREIEHERELLGVPSSEFQLRSIRRDLYEIDRIHVANCIEVFGTVPEKIDSRKGASLGFVALRMLQSRRDPSMTYYSEHQVPRPFIFNRKFPVLPGFMYVMNSFAPKAEGISIDYSKPFTLLDVVEAEEIDRFAVGSSVNKHKMHIVPSAKKYADNASVDNLMFAYDTGELHEDVYEAFSINAAA